MANKIKIIDSYGQITLDIQDVITIKDGEISKQGNLSVNLSTTTYDFESNEPIVDEDLNISFSNTLFTHFLSIPTLNLAIISKQIQNLMTSGLIIMNKLTSDFYYEFQLKVIYYNPIGNICYSLNDKSKSKWSTLLKLNFAELDDSKSIYIPLTFDYSQYKSRLLDLMNMNDIIQRFIEKRTGDFQCQKRTK